MYIIKILEINVCSTPQNLRPHTCAVALSVLVTAGTSLTLLGTGSCAAGAHSVTGCRGRAEIHQCSLNENCVIEFF